MLQALTKGVECCGRWRRSGKREPKAKTQPQEVSDNVVVWQTKSATGKDRPTTRPNPCVLQRVWDRRVPPNEKSRTLSSRGGCQDNDAATQTGRHRGRAAQRAQDDRGVLPEKTGDQINAVQWTHAVAQAEGESVCPACSACSAC